MRNNKLRIVNVDIVSHPQKRLAVLAIAMLLLSITPALFAQHDVHAGLIVAADRKPAPTFHLVAETGKTTRISDYRGKVVLLNFWATDCGGCVLEIPSFIELEAAYKHRAFTAVGISMDISYENLKDADEAWGKARPFVASHKINYPILMGYKSIYKEYALTELPDTFLIDKSGRIAAVYVGVVNKDNVEANIRRLLSER